MEFRGRGAALTQAGQDQALGLLGVTPPAIWSVITVETRGCGFLVDRRPQILFERHIFHRRTGGRFSAAHPDISNATAGGYVGGAGEYERLQGAIALDRDAALCSASWGLGQIMGFNAESAGFNNAEAMVSAFCEGEDAHLIAMARCIEAIGAAAPLRLSDWRAFARKYNGPSYERNQYHTRLNAEHAKLASGVLPDLDVRGAQLYLVYLGYQPGIIDGIAGRRTRSALAEFQLKESLPVTERLDKATMSRLRKCAGVD